MSENTSKISEAAPWRRGIAWWILVVEGIAAVLIGLYMLVAPTQAGKVLALLLAFWVTLSGALQLWAGFRRRRKRYSMLILIRGAVGVIAGVTAGAIIFLTNSSSIVSLETAEWILGIGLVVYGLLGIILSFLDRGKGGIRWGTILNSLLVLFIGALFLYDKFTEVEMFQVIAGLALLFGTLLIIYGVVLYRKLPEDTDALSS